MPGPLISVADLHAIRDNAVTILDCRWYLGEPDAGSAAYAVGHIPGAIYCSLDTDLAGPEGQGRHPLPTPDAFAGTMERFGVSPERTVVVYDDRGGAVASRLWWMLTDQGHASTFILDGGLPAWVDAGYGLTTEPATALAGSFRARPWIGVIDRNGVVDRAATTAVIDARSVERYVGDAEPMDPKAGHIPGALSMPLTDNLNETHQFLPSESLRDRFAEAGITDGADVISQCGSGVTACHNIAAMEIAGLGRPLLYVGSWSDWSATDLPIATGSAP
ncbi:MAG: sulfurtransferase [Acidimicrobiia bacterium]